MPPAGDPIIWENTIAENGKALHAACRIFVPIMTSLTLQQLIPVIQTAVGPVILISGGGVLLLSFTNRFGRIVDRSRLLARELPSATAERDQLSVQLAILYRRAKVLRLSIVLATASVLLAGFLIISLFLAALLHLEAPLLVSLCFILCMASLIASLIVFLLDLQMSLTALRVELAQAGFKAE
jgi:hypothetical protein